MTESDIQKIEEAIGKMLPPSYKNILLNYPPELAEPIENDEAINAVILPNDANQLIDTNLRVDKYIRATSKIVIGSDGCGNDFLIDNIDEKIYEIDHEECKYFDAERTQFDFLGSLKYGCESISEYIEIWKRIKKGGAL